MWFFGFSTSTTRNFLIIGAIFLVILLAVILRKLALYQLNDHGNDRTGDKNQDGLKHTFTCTAVVRTYALEELKMATRNFRIRVGVGATSYVYLAELRDGRFGALKRVMEERGGSRKMFLDEVSVLLRISHPNLVGLLGFCLEEGEQLLLLEYVPNKSLFDRMHTLRGQSDGILSWSNRMSIALDIARALDYLHSQADPPIIHRDVKSSNILLIDDDHAKLADFGLCKLGYESYMSQTPCVVKGSFGYVDVNYLRTGIVTPKSDVYSFGVLLLELITGLKSMQGSATLPEWTAECRRSGNVEDLIGMLDPKIKDEVNVKQLLVMLGIANATLIEYSDARPEMSQIVDMLSSCLEDHAPAELLV